MRCGRTEGAEILVHGLASKMGFTAEITRSRNSEMLTETAGSDMIHLLPEPETGWRLRGCQLGKPKRIRWKKPKWGKLL
jgi:hypothetical protein